MWSLGEVENSRKLVAIALLALVVGIGVFFYHRRAKALAARNRKPARPKAFIVVSDESFEVPCVALAMTVFRRARLDVVLATQQGKRTTPDARSLETPVAKAAAARNDPVWLKVLDMGNGPRALSRVRTSDVAALFIAGGPRMLADLRQTDLSGASPTPYCLTLRALAEEVLAAGGAVGAVGHGVRGEVRGRGRVPGHAHALT